MQNGAKFIYYKFSYTMKNKRLIWVVGLLLIMNSIAFGQPGNPGDGPIGGIIYLLLAGVGFGIYSLRKKRG